MAQRISNKSKWLNNQLADASDLLLSFHSRVADESKTKVVQDAKLKLPSKFYSIGDAIRTNYSSDKDDPATRHPSKRANDPDGVQGVMKKFTHKHTEGVGLKLYAPFTGTIPLNSRFVNVAEVEWPDVIVFLGDLTGIEYDKYVGYDDKSNFTDTTSVNGLKLYCFPDTRTLVAVSKSLKVPYMWHGGDLKVSWEGIQG